MYMCETKANTELKHASSHAILFYANLGSFGGAIVIFT